EASSVGASIELDKIPRHKSISWDDWLKMYPGAGFVLTAPEKHVDECISLLSEVNITSKVTGEIIKEKKLKLSYKKQEEVLFDFKTDRIMGVKEDIEN
ncbi:MAG TPA: AIR synthase-related protein, partial [Methanobacterium sp.]|nr:AIR synthase-related protein [Methanobacterium sp.]